MNELPDRTSIPPWWEIGVKPTNRELAHWLSITSDDNRDWWLDRIQENADVAGRCFEFGHDSLTDQLNDAYRRLREANARIEWLERNNRPTTPSVLPEPPRIPERQGKAVSEAHAANTGHVSERESQ